MFEVPEKEIAELIDRKPDSVKALQTLCSVSVDNPLTLQEVSDLIKAGSADREIFNAVLKKAGEIKREIFGNRVKLFVPLYLSNVCVNECAYCSYRAQNSGMPRKTLSDGELRAEIAEVGRMGYRVIELVTSESPALSKPGMLRRCIETTREELRKVDCGEGSEIILMSWVPSDDELKEIAGAGLDAFYLWQETYDRTSFEKLHPKGTPKSDYRKRIDVFDRLMEAGIGRVGLGVLFGLGEWEIEVLSLIAHGRYLEGKYGVGPDAIGVPRFKHAEGASLKEAPYTVTDDNLRLAVAVYRLAFPGSQIFLNTREKLNLILDLLDCGGSEVNIACAVYPGGYTQPRSDRQFDFYNYPTERTIEVLRERGYEVTHFAGGIKLNECR